MFVFWLHAAVTYDSQGIHALLADTVKSIITREIRLQSSHHN